ncbi:MAG: hypothetical protein A3H51_01855 [Candidatus Spechtbacteria bacterium RIFCSPLOWO2_02_FULL_38_8]|uniref:AI-2E family transporter n=1 Tax=Candidatus Spechtbacteria bacterium RIFCSPLOWO2_02_FULL_38_8 TaxID=1802164 RepID=A0A1G2HH06_9BACT|nr:MAG: hypothetical protein A3H51_01855 [Candidatus Spechtbacteria bacterium RIFCSPLOWO2_02_FULL_38_8]
MLTKLKTTDISTSTIFRVLTIVLVVVLFFKIWQIVASLFLAIVISTAIEPTLRWLERHSIKRIISVPSLYLLAIAAFFGIFYAILPSLFNEVFVLSQDLPQKLGKIVEEFGSSAFSSVGFLVPALDELFVNFQTKLGAAIPDVVSFISRIFGGILTFLLVIVFSFYLSLRKNDIENSLLAITPPRHKDYVRDLVRRMQKRTGRWLQAVFVLATFMGIAVFAVLTLLGIKFSLTLGIIAGFLEVIPFIGPFIAGILIFGTASTQSLVTGLIAVGAYIALQQIQQIFITPSVMGKAVGLNPLMVLLAVLIGAELAGLWGIIIAIPLAAAFGELFRDLYGIKK